MRKRILLIILSIFIFASGVHNVYAEDGVHACINGYHFYVTGYGSEENLDNLIRNNFGVSDANLAMQYFDNGRADIGNGVQISASGLAKNHCYAVYKNGEQASADTGWWYKVTNFSYNVKNCGSKYDLNLSFKDGSKVTIDGTKYSTTNIIDPNTGIISLIITPDDNSKLKSVFNRVVATYSRVVKINEKNKKIYETGNCSNDGSKIVCSNIKPYDSTGLPTYTISFSLNGIYASDFVENENVNQYINSCGGASGQIYLGELSTTIVSAENVQVNNPAKTDGTLKELCRQISEIPNADKNLLKAYASECYADKINYTEKDTIKNKITDKLNNLLKMFDKKTSAEGLIIDSKKGDLICTNPLLGLPTENINADPFETKIIYQAVGKYFGMICFADYYVDPGDPSLVKAGTGVDYSNKVLINKTCSIFQVSQVKMKPLCDTKTMHEIRCDHGHDGVYGSGEVAGGPNSSFDQCINRCDGGKYTQSCINSCYIDSYNDSRSNELSKDYSKISNFNFSNNYNITKINTQVSHTNVDLNESNVVVTAGSLGTNSSYTNGPYRLEVKKSTKGGSISYENYGTNFGYNPGDYLLTLYYNGVEVAHSGRGATCAAECAGLRYILRTPVGCVDVPDTVYNNEIGDATNELRKYEEEARKQSQIEEYNISIKDSKTNNIYEISGSTISDIIDKPKLEINDISKEDNLKSWAIDYVVGTQNRSTDTVNGYAVVETQTIYEIKLPLARVEKNNSEMILVENKNKDNKENSYYQYKNNKAIKNDNKVYFNFTKFNGDVNNLYTSGTNSYYTYFESPATNVIYNSNKTEEELKNIPYVILRDSTGKTDVIELSRDDDNISVKLRIGNGENYLAFQDAKFNCYYGVYQQDIITKGYNDNNQNINVTNISKNHKGLRYYYREIDLNDMFNERNPRYNWTGTIINGEATGSASNKNPSYIVDPEKLIESIEKKGYTIYDNDSNEVDYKYTLTINAINELRKYNKAKRNDKKITYLDFSLAIMSNQGGLNYSEVVDKYLGDNGLNRQTTSNITECNNAKPGTNTCDNY